MGPIGMQEMIAIFVIALVLFGPKKLPELGRTLGKALSEFRRAKNELKSTFESHLQELERETRIENYSNKNGYPAARYPYPYEEYKYESSSSSSYESSSYESPQADAASSAEAPQLEAHDESAVRALPVADTVPRNNGARQVDARSTAHDEDHPLS